MRVIIYSSHNFPPMQAFAQGVEAHGDRVISRNFSMYKSDSYEKCDVCIVFGMQKPVTTIFENQRAHQTPVYVVDMGYVKRGTTQASRENPDDIYWSVGLNGLNGKAESVRATPGDRWDKLKAPLQPWQAAGTGEYLLLCGQKNHDAALGDLDPFDFGFYVAARLRRTVELSCLPLRYRPHPDSTSSRKIPHTEQVDSSIQEDLAGASLVLAYNSNILTDAVIAGVPAVALGSGAMIEPIAPVVQYDSMSDLEWGRELKARLELRPDRQQWAHDLAYRQWNLTELADGAAWDFLKNGSERISGSAMEGGVGGNNKHRASRKTGAAHKAQAKEPDLGIPDKAEPQDKTDHGASGDGAAAAGTPR